MLNIDLIQHKTSIHNYVYIYQNYLKGTYYTNPGLT